MRGAANVRAGLSVTLASLALAGCTIGGPDRGEPAAAAPAVEVVDSRLVEGADLCALAGAEELEWLLGRPLVAGPSPDPAEPASCAARFTDTTITIAGRTSAGGTRAMVAGNAAFAEPAGDGCRVSVALLPGGTTRAGSYLSVLVDGPGPAGQPPDCRTAGRVAGYLLRLLPQH